MVRPVRLLVLVITLLTLVHLLWNGRAVWRGEPLSAHGWTLLLHLLVIAVLGSIHHLLGVWQRERARLGAVVDALAEGFALYDRHGRLLLCNQPFAAFYGAVPGELEGELFSDLLKRAYPRYRGVVNDGNVPVENLDTLVRTWETCFESPESLTVDLLTDDQRSYRIRSHSTHSGERLILRTEITDLKTTETALRQREAELEDRNLLLRALQETAPDGFVAVAADGHFITHNRRFGEMWGIPPEILASQHRNVAGRYLDSLVHDADTIRQQIERAYADPSMAFHRETHLKDGRIFEAHTAPLPAMAGAGSGRVWFYRDITELRRLERETRQREERLQAAIDVLGDGFALFGADDRLIRCNPGFAGLYDRTPEDLHGQYHDDILRDGYRRGVGMDTGDLSFEEWRTRLARGRRQLSSRTLELQSRDGRWFLVTERLTASDELVLVRTDISRQKQQELELRRLATTDSLTGALNHGQFMEQAGLELQRSRRYNHPLTLLMLDADHFKAVNDTQGHASGDEVLRQLVRAVRQELRGNDLIGRLGGEEFAVLLPETHQRAADAVAWRLCERLRDLRLTGNDGVFGITVSIGVAARESWEDTLEILLQRADQALYRAKAEGRDRVCTS